MKTPSKDSQEQFANLLKEAYAGRLAWLDKLVIAAGYNRLPGGLEADVASRPGLPAALLAYVSPSQAALMLGCNERTIRNYCAAGDDGAPQLPHRKVGGGQAYQVQTAVVYEYLLRHCKRLPKGLHPPPGWISAEDADRRAQGVASVAPELKDPIERLEQALSDPKQMQQLGFEQVRVMSAALEVLRRDREAKSRQAKRFGESEVEEIVRAVGAEFIRQFVIWTPTLTGLLLSYIREKFGTDLLAANIAARELILALIQNNGDEMIRGFRLYVDERAKGVQFLKGTL